MMLEKTLESLLDCKEIQSVHPKGDQSWVFIGRTMLKLKLQYFGHLMQRVDSLEKTLMLGGLGGKRRRGWQRMRWLDGINDSMGMGLGRLREFVMDREAWCADSWGCRVGHDWATELNWTELKPLIVQGSTVFPYNLAHPLVYFKSSLDYLKYFAVVVQSLSCVQLFATPWTAACQASLSFTICWNLLKLMFIESAMPSNHLVLYHPLLLHSVIFSIRVFPVSCLCIWGPKYWSFSFSISLAKEYSGLISFRIDWFGLLAAQGPLKSLLQHQFFGGQPSLWSNSYIHTWLPEKP